MVFTYKAKNEVYGHYYAKAHQLKWATIRVPMLANAHMTDP